MAEFKIRESGSTEVPEGGTAVADILTTRNDSADDMMTVNVVLKDGSSNTLSDETWVGVDISDTATDGGAIELTDPPGTGTQEWKYTVPSGTYTTPEVFTVTITITDTDGATNGGQTFEFTVVGATVSVDLATSTIAATAKRRAKLLEYKQVFDDGPSSTGLPGSGTIVDLGAGLIFDLDTLWKNGGKLTRGTDYTWSTFSTRATLTGAGASTPGDHYTALIQVRMSNEEVDDFVDESLDFVRGHLSAYYDDDDLMTHPTVEAIVTARTVGYLKEELAKGALDSPDYRSARELMAETTAMVMAIKRGEANINDSEGDVVSRREFALAGGFKHPDGASKSRLDLIDRVQRWNGIIRDYYPESVLRLSTLPETRRL